MERPIHAQTPARRLRRLRRRAAVIARPFPLPKLAALGFAAWLIPACADAQDFERRVPSLPVPENPTVTTPPETQQASQDQTVLLPNLAGVVFVDGLSALRTTGLSVGEGSAGVRADRLPLLANEAFLARIRPYLGQPLTRAGLDEIVRQAREVYRAAGHPFMEIVAPPQNVQSGVIQIVVTEYRVGQVEVVGDKHFSPKLVQRWGDLQPGEPMTLLRFRDALEDYNQNPFATVDAVVKPGAETGLSDVSLQVDDRSPWRVYTGYDNLGSRTLGRAEWNVGVNWGNVFGTGQILSYQYTRSASGQYDSHSVSDVIPLRGGDKVLLFGAYATQIPDIAPDFASKGHSSQISIRYVRKLPSQNRFRQSLQVGFDYKRVDNNLEFAGLQLLDTAVEIDQFPLIYNASLSDRHGQTEVENQLVFSPGGVTDNNTDADIRMLVPGGNASYVYDRLSITRTTQLPHGVVWIARALGQAATDNLPYSEQVGAGGIGTVRGYDTNIALGSNALLLSTELRAPAFRVARGLFEDEMQLGVFFDYADLGQKTDFPDLPANVKLSSIGVNAHYNIARNFNLQIEVGSQLRKTPDTRKRDTMVQFVTSLAF
jgi:hemolysin activation/secretion protein